MSLAALAEAAQPHHLAVFGACRTMPEDGLGKGTLVLLGPCEPGFWAHVTAEPEFSDTAPDPLDRWSTRIINALARDCGGCAFFPFGDPPRPFIRWALRSRRAWTSPVGLLVHDQAGLMVSYRGAILIEPELDLPQPTPSPCEACIGKPCLSACPIGALSGDSYRTNDCHAFLESPPGQDCMSTGCAVRRSCPVSQSYARQDAQSAYHMHQFHRR